MRILLNVALAIFMYAVVASADTTHSRTYTGDNCIFGTEHESEDKINVFFRTGPDTHAYARFTIPLSVLPLKEGTKLDLSDALTDQGLSYKNGYLKIWKRDRANFFESDSLGIYVDVNLENPKNASLWEGLNYIPLQRTKCSF